MPTFKFSDEPVYGVPSTLPHGDSDIMGRMIVARTKIHNTVINKRDKREECMYVLDEKRKHTS
jgi:hypothetical protein